MILAGIQPSAVWFRVLQGTAAPTCHQLCGGCLTLSLCPTAGWRAGSCTQARAQGMGESCWSRVALWDSSARLCVSSGPALWRGGSSGGSLLGEQVMPGMGWAVGKLPSGTVGLAGSCRGPFWGTLQLQLCSQDASAFQSSSGGREQPGGGTLLGQQGPKQPGQVVFP